MLVKNYLFYTLLMLAGVSTLSGCNDPEVKNRRVQADYIKEIPGENDSIPAGTAQKGEVLIAYADCYTCHKEEKKSIGPAFRDIARRYPVQEVYISMLAQKIISGGSGGWGKAIMSAHPDLALDDAKIMVSYILSLEEKP